MRFRLTDSSMFLDVQIIPAPDSKTRMRDIRQQQHAVLQFIPLMRYETSAHTPIRILYCYL